MDLLTAPIAHELELFDQRMDDALRADVELAHEIARYMAALQGKRLRPTLALLSARAVGYEDERAIDAAVAVEMIHAATMIHDDVVDAASMRRGRPSVGSAWSGQLAVLMGDFLLSRALCILVGLDNLPALGAVARATERLSIGEIHEIQIGRQLDTSQDSYFRMVSDKTASLITASVQMGPILAQAAPRVIDAMGAYGEALGTAFQIADDILDFTGNAATLGKPVGIDLREGKITLPLILALERAPAPVRQSINRLMKCDHKSNAEWHRLVDFVNEHAGVAAAQQCASQHAETARRALHELAPSPAREALEFAVRRAVERQH